MAEIKQVNCSGLPLVKKLNLKNVKAVYRELEAKTKL